MQQQSKKSKKFDKGGNDKMSDVKYKHREGVEKGNSEIFELNNEIAKFASRKDLTSAMQIFNRALERGIANTHTYCTALNANVRCGNMPEAIRIFDLFRSSGRYQLDVISCTTLMKGKRFFDSYLC